MTAAQTIEQVTERLTERWTRVVDWLAGHELDEGLLLMLLAVTIGIVAGLGVVIFYRLIDLFYFVFVDLVGSRMAEAPHALYRPALTALGLWCAWFLVRRTRTPPGQNVADVQLAVAKRGGIIRTRPVIVRTISSAITLGSGGSAGSEGPTAVLGATSGSIFGRALRFQPRRLKILVGCGAAAGIAAAFNAPFAGAFFALEEVLGSFSVGAFSPVVIASVAGALTVRPFLGSHPAFHIPEYGSVRPIWIALLYPLLGVGCGLASALYTRMYFRAGEVFGGMRGPHWARPVLGGALVGLIVLFSGGLLVGNGHLAIPTPVFGRIAWYLLVALAIAKMLATAVTMGSGGSGGVFTPTLFIGAAFGGGLGRLAADLLPNGGVHPEAWGIVGMAGLVAGAVRAPLTAIFMVFDMTDDYGIVPALMIVAVIAYAVARKAAPHGLYDGWLAERGEHLAHGADRALMDRIRVREAMDGNAVTVSPSASLGEIVAAAAQTRHTTIPVVEPDDHTLVGVITYDDLRQAMLDRGDLAHVLVAADLAAPVELATPEQSLREVLSRMNARALDVLPVVRDSVTPVLLGVVSRRDVLAAYERELMHEV